MSAEAASAIVDAAKSKPQLTTLCGSINLDQMEIDLSEQGYGLGDAILLAAELKNSVLKTLKCAARFYAAVSY